MHVYIYVQVLEWYYLVKLLIFKEILDFYDLITCPLSRLALQYPEPEGLGGEHFNDFNNLNDFNDFNNLISCPWSRLRCAGP